jgi:hypothetical protein
MSMEGEERSTEKAMQTGDVASKGDGLGSSMVGGAGSTADRLYALLDTLLALRMDFDDNGAVKGRAYKLEEIRALLDRAIAYTKDIIEDVRPRL